MKLTKSKLKQIIKEELGRVVKEATGTPRYKDWWTEKPKEILRNVYWEHGKLPPSGEKAQKAAFDKIIAKLQDNPKKRAPEGVEIPEWFDAEAAFEQLQSRTKLNFRPEDIEHLKGSSNEKEFRQRVEQIWEPEEEDF